VFFPVNALSRIANTRAAAPALVHSTLYRPVRLMKRCPLVTTIHDLIVYRRPEIYSGRAAARFRRWIEWSARRAAAILTVSEVSREQIVRILRVPREKVHVTYPGVDAAFGPPLQADVEQFKVSRGLKRPYVLYVGQRGGHKNFNVVAEAFRLGLLEDFELLAVGGEAVGPAGAAIRHLAALSDEELQCAYAGAAALVFPSLDEGFGLPLVEAMSCGTAIAASDIPTNREIAGTASVLFDPSDARACAEAILAAAGSSRARLIEEARHRLARFSWVECARRTLQVYREVLGR
jgi:glycosyltransferase involved in cell wall biosynthesis